MINHVLIILIPEPGYSRWQAAQGSKAIPSLYEVPGTYAAIRSIFLVTEYYLLEQTSILASFVWPFKAWLWTLGHFNCEKQIKIPHIK